MQGRDTALVHDIRICTCRDEGILSSLLAHLDSKQVSQGPELAYVRISCTSALRANRPFVLGMSSSQFDPERSVSLQDLII